jgi:hypothetical protein
MIDVTHQHFETRDARLHYQQPFNEITVRSNLHLRLDEYQ